MTSTAVPLVAAVVATAVSGWFAVRLSQRFVAGGRTNLAMGAWSVSLAMFSIASAALLAGVVVGFTPAVFRVFYLFGAVLNVPWLALGSVYINTRDRVTSVVSGVVVLLVAAAFVPGFLRGEPLTVIGVLFGVPLGVAMLLPRESWVRVAAGVTVVAVSLAAVVVVLGTDFTAALPSSGLPEGREVFPESVRAFSVGGNAIGSFVVIIGAIVASGRLGWRLVESAVKREVGETGRRFPVEALAQGVLRGWRALREADLGHVAVGNLLIALGVVIAAGSGGMFSFLGDTTSHAVGLGLGVLVMFAGFDRTTRPLPDGALDPRAVLAGRRG